MARLPYEPRNFQTSLPLWHPRTSLNTPGQVSASMATIRLHAMTVGTPRGVPWWSAFGGRNSSLGRRDLAWLGDAAQSCLVERNGYWELEPSFHELDASEKVFHSYRLGMTQASIMADRILGTTAMVHVDSVLKLLGVLVPEKRPDLIGFSLGRPGPSASTTIRPSRILMEAKGTSKAKDATTIATALNQVKPAPTGKSNQNLQQLAHLLGRNALRIASLAFFDVNPAGGLPQVPVWQSYLEDPPETSDTVTSWSDDEFSGLLLLAKLLPLYSILRTEKIEEFVWSEYINVPMAQFAVDADNVIGLPSAYLEVLEETLSRDHASLTTERYRALRELSLAIHALAPDPARVEPNEQPVEEVWGSALLRCGVSLASRHA